MNELVGLQVVLLAVLLELRSSGLADTTVEEVYERYHTLCKVNDFSAVGWGEVVGILTKLGAGAVLSVQAGALGGCAQVALMGITTDMLENSVLKEAKELPWLATYVVRK
jgi:hypothetical protein